MRRGPVRRIAAGAGVSLAVHGMGFYLGSLCWSACNPRSTLDAASVQPVALVFLPPTVPDAASPSMASLPVPKSVAPGPVVSSGVEVPTPPPASGPPITPVSSPPPAQPEPAEPSTSPHPLANAVAPTESISAEPSASPAPLTAGVAKRACWAAVGRELGWRAAHKVPRSITRRRIRGEVVVRFALDSGGQATALKIESCSGSSLLEEATRAMLVEPFTRHCAGHGRWEVTFGPTPGARLEKNL